MVLRLENEIMGDGLIPNTDAVYQTLRALKILRSAVTYTFENLATGLQSSSDDHDGEEGTRSKFIEEMQQCLKNLNDYLRDLEVASNKLVPPPGPLTLSNIGHIYHDTGEDRHSLYLETIQSYKWADKVHEFASHAVNTLAKNSLKRSSFTLHGPRKPKKVSPALSTQILDNVILLLGRRYPDMQFTVTRPYGESPVVQINLGKTLKVAVVLRNLIIEQVVVKGYNEEITAEDGTVDIWSNSRYKVFQKVTDHANAAMLHYFEYANVGMSLKLFLMWLHSYATLFTSPCHNCGYHLNQYLPPTLRDFRNLLPYHEACQ